MTVSTDQNQAKDNTKEYNFRAQEAKFQRELAIEKEKIQALERRIETKELVPEDDDDDFDEE